MLSKINQFILPVAILGFGFLIGQGLQKFNRNERSISVRGLAEKEVRSNVAVWKINYNISADRIENLREQLPVTQKIIQDFLNTHGFQNSEISKSSNIKDREAVEYGAEKGKRFVANGTYMVTTSKVDEIQKTQQLVDELVKKGLVLTNEHIEFYFTDLNQIKPEMLDLATKNAKEAALGFAKSMDVGVGKMKSASQGVFSIENPIGGSVDGEYGSGGTASSLIKKVRVVTQVEFYVD
jgi:uncharacterized protein